jgi:hypothetical protein
MHHVRNAMALHDLQRGCLVPQVHLLENVFGVTAHLLEIGEMPGIGEAIEIYQTLDFGLIDNVMDQVGADESGATGDEEFHTIIVTTPIKLIP